MLFPDVDPRLAKWPLMETATKVVLIDLLYLIFVLVLGPAYMRHRKPYDLRKLMIAYNFAIVGYSAWMFYKFGKHGWFGKYNWLCAPVDFSVDEDSMGMVQVCWHFFISKIIEQLDTVFFILRKKNSQVTFLHVFHHALVPLTGRFAISRGAAGFNTMFGFVNTFIHTWMYLYYGLAALGPSVQKYLWWKKYITSLQMMQFCIIIFGMVSHVIIPGCEANTILITVSLGQALVFLVLFLVFYKTTYRKKPIVTVDVPPTEDTVEVNGNDSGLKYRSRSERQSENGYDSQI